MSVLLNALRGGPVEWQVRINGEYYTDNLVSVTGISRKAQLDGSFTSATVTVTLYGQEGDIQAGQSVTVYFNDKSQSSSVALWSGTVSAVNKTSRNTREISCIGTLSKLDKDATAYYARGCSPRDLFKKGLSAALSTGSSISVPSYNDGYHRGDVRVSTKYSTLAKLSGIASYSSPIVSEANWTSSTYVNEWSLTLSNTYHFFDMQNWATFLEDDRPLANTPDDKLAWHRTGTGLKCSLYSFGQIGSSTVKSYWPVGQDAIYNFYLTCDNGQSMYTDSLGLQYEDSEGNLRGRDYIHMAPSEESKDYPNSTYTSWREGANARLHTLWAPTNSTMLDSRTFKHDLSSWNSSASNVYYGVHANHQFHGELIYNHVDISTDLTSKITSASSLGNRYLVVQTIYPETIAPDPVTWSIAEEAAWLGSIALVECGNSYGAKVVDVCPEKGTIYEIPICASTCSSVSFVQNCPLPTTVKANFRTPWATEYTYNVPCSDVSVSSDKEIHIVNGLVGGTNGGGDINGAYYNLAGHKAIAPGFCIDRWTGVTCYNSSNASFNIISEGYGIALKIQGSSGEQVRLTQNFYNAQSSMAPAGTSTYEVRERGGTTYRAFADHAYIAPVYSNGQMRYLPASKDPWLDIFPINSLRDANNRVFVDHLRPKWKVEVPLAFVTCEPGQVVVLDLKEITDEPYLAMVTSNECSSDKATVTLELMPMFIAVGASQSDWPNISEVLNIATSLSAPNNAPYLPSNLLSNNARPEFDNVEKITQTSTWTDTSYWHVLVNGQYNTFNFNLDSEVHIRFKNSRTGFASEQVIRSYDYHTRSGDPIYNRFAEVKKVNEAILGDGQTENGLILFTTAKMGASAQIIWNCQDVPDLSDWTIEVCWDNNTMQPWVEEIAQLTGWSRYNVYYEMPSTLYNQNDIVNAYWNTETRRLAIGFTRYGWTDLYFGTSLSSSSSTSKVWVFELPSDGVYTEMRTQFVKSTNSYIYQRFTIASAFRDGYPGSSSWASQYFDPSITDYGVANLYSDATIKLYKLVR